MYAWGDVPVNVDLGARRHWCQHGATRDHRSEPGSTYLDGARAGKTTCGCVRVRADWAWEWARPSLGPKAAVLGEYVGFVCMGNASPATAAAAVEAAPVCAPSPVMGLRPPASSCACDGRVSLRPRPRSARLRVRRRRYDAGSMAASRPLSLRLALPREEELTPVLRGCGDWRWPSRVKPVLRAAGDAGVGSGRAATRTGE